MARVNPPVFPTLSSFLLAIPLSPHPAPTLRTIALKTPLQSGISSLPPVTALDRVIADTLALCVEELVCGAGVLAPALPLLLLSGNHQLLLLAGTLRQREIAGAILGNLTSQDVSDYSRVVCISASQSSTDF